MFWKPLIRWLMKSFQADNELSNTKEMVLGKCLNGGSR